MANPALSQARKALLQRGHAGPALSAADICRRAPPSQNLVIALPGRQRWFHVELPGMGKTQGHEPRESGNILPEEGLQSYVC